MGDNQGSQSWPVRIVIQGVDELAKPLKEVNARLEKISSPVKQIGAEFAHLGHVTGITHLAGELKEVHEKAKEVGKEAFELGAKLVTMEALGVGATFELAKSMAEAGHEVGETSKLLGIHVGWLQEMQYAGARVGVSNEELNAGLYKLSKNIGESAAYTGEALVAFRALGINVRDSHGHIKSLEQILPQLADRLKAVHSESVRNALSAKLFGREGGRNMAKLLGEGSKGLEEARERAKALGFEMGEDGVKSSEKFMEAFTNVKFSLIGLRNTVGGALLPAFRDAMGSLVQFFQSHRQEIKQFADDFAKHIPELVQTASTTAEGIFSAAKKIVGAFKWVSDIIGPTNTALLLMATTIGAPLIGSILSLTGALIQLGPSLVATAVRIGALAIGPVVAAFGNLFTAIQAGYPIMEAFNLVLASNPIGAIILGVTALGVAAYELIKHWDAVKSFFSSLWGMITAGIDAVKDKLGPLTYLIPGFGQVAAVRDIYHHFDSQAPSLGAPMGAQQIASAAAEAQRPVQQSAAVKVSFDNLPKGARVSTEKQVGAPLELSMGYAMVHP